MPRLAKIVAAMVNAKIEQREQAFNHVRSFKYFLTTRPLAALTFMLFLT